MIKLNLQVYDIIHGWVLSFIKMGPIICTLVERPLSVRLVLI